MPTLPHAYRKLRTEATGRSRHFTGREGSFMLTRATRNMMCPCLWSIAALCVFRTAYALVRSTFSCCTASSPLVASLASSHLNALSLSHSPHPSLRPFPPPLASHIRASLASPALALLAPSSFTLLRSQLRRPALACPGCYCGQTAGGCRLSVGDVPPELSGLHAERLGGGQHC